MKWFGLAITALVVLNASISAGERKPKAPLTLRLLAKTDRYKFDGAGKTADEYRKSLEDAAKAIAAGKAEAAPKAIPVNLLLRITNTSKEEVTIYVGGDSNSYTLDLAGGAGTIAMDNPAPTTLDFRSPMAVTLAAGKSHEIPVKVLADGKRGLGRLVFWTGPGVYKLTAKYALSDKDGGAGEVLKSEPVKVTVEK